MLTLDPEPPAQTEVVENVSRGIRCVWHVLEVHGAAALNHLCRLLAADGFPYRLLRALNAIISDMLSSPTGMQVSQSVSRLHLFQPPRAVQMS